MMRSSSCGSPGIQPHHGRGRAIQDAVEDQSWAVAAKRLRPVAISYSTTPNENRSVRASTSSAAPVPATCTRRSPRHSPDSSSPRASVRPPSARHRHPSAGFGQPEVENLGVAAAGDEQIRRLDVAVDDPGGVRRLERIGDLDRECQQQVDVERAPGDTMLQRRPVEELHDQERAAVLFADIVDGADVCVIQGRGRSRLPEESGERLGVVARSGDRNFSPTKRCSRVSSAR